MTLEETETPKQKKSCLLLRAQSDLVQAGMTEGSLAVLFLELLQSNKAFVTSWGRPFDSNRMYDSK